MIAYNLSYSWDKVTSKKFVFSKSLHLYVKHFIYPVAQEMDLSKGANAYATLSITVPEYERARGNFSKLKKLLVGKFNTQAIERELMMGIRMAQKRNRIIKSDPKTFIDNNKLEEIL